ncbi:large subunit ribosomal protein L18e [Nematocida sp. AWRm80]|nr:large subunit ribosomal protein L18e [Nematocida sp. AWRm80]
MLLKPSKPRGGRKEPKTLNEEVQTLYAVFDAVAKKSTHDIYAKIAKHLAKPRVQRASVNLKQLIYYTKPCQDKLAVVVSKILGHDAIVEIKIPITVACLDISVAAKQKIEKYGGKVYKLDEIFTVCPNPEDMVLFQAKTTSRKANKFFGSPTDKRKPAYPRVITKGSEKRRKPVR